MKARNSSLPRILLFAILCLSLTATLAVAQPKAETAPAPADQKQGPTAASETGVLVVGVQTGSPAEKAGLARGDIILEANGTAVNTVRDLQVLVDARKSGDAMTLKVRHGDAEKTLSVTLGSRSGAGWLGVRLYPDGPREGERFGRMYGPRPFAEGALVETVAAGSPAEKAGLKQGDVILSVDGATIGAESTLTDLISSKKIGDTVTLSVETPVQGAPGRSRDLTVILAKNPDKDAPWLGVQYTMAPPRFGRMMPGPGTVAGVLVAEVTADSPAAKAGIKTEDLITRVEGVTVSSPRQVVDAVSRRAPGDTLRLTISRAGDAADTDVTVTLGKNLQDASRAWMGLSMSGPMGQRGPWGDDDGGPGGMMRGPRMHPPFAPGPEGPSATL